MTKQETRMAILNKLTEMGHEVMLGKDGGFYIKEMGWVSYEAARKLAKIEKHEVKPRNTEKVMPWGDYATIAMMNGIKVR